MAYTQTDLDNIDQAILDFALGNRAGTVTIGGHTVEYAEVTLEQLRALRDVIAVDLVSDYSPRVLTRNCGRGF